MKIAVAVAIGLALAGCARTQATKVSANTVLIDAGAAPICGSAGAAKAASRAAAIETIKNGFDRYIITGAQSRNNVTVTETPGSYRTVGTYGGGSYQATSTYTPGVPIVSGSHDRSLAVVMFRPGDVGFEQGIDARSELGADWKEIVENGVRTCL